MGNGTVADSTELEVSFTNMTTGYSVVFVDNARVAYAYLLDLQANVVVDVWLFNRCETSREPEWAIRKKMLFANSADFSKDHFGYKPMDEVLAVDVRWGEDDRDNVNVSILIRGGSFWRTDDGNQARMVIDGEERWAIGQGAIGGSQSACRLICHVTACHHPSCATMTRKNVVSVVRRHTSPT